jgi:hypothetical protein
MKLDLLTNATVVDDAIRFVSESEKFKDKAKDQVKSSSSSFLDSSNEEDKESKEPDYDDDDDDEKSDKVGEEKQEEQTGQIPTNQVF